MNPRHRRLLIPGLLVVLIVVVVIASIARRADASTARAHVVSTISDPRITESSGLAVSRTHADLAYTINDSGHAPVVFAIRISTGQVVGTTTVRGVTWRDTEAMALDGRGRLWVADTGDNEGDRDDVALYALDEPGPDTRTATATRYPLTYDGGPQDVESLAVDPGSGRFVLVTKGLLSGDVLTLPARLRTDAPNVPRATDASTLLLATDASWSSDGRWVVVRNYVSAVTLDARTWRTVSTVTLPEQPQGETLAFESDGSSYLIGSEGEGSALQRVGFSARGAAAVPTATASPTASATPADAEEASALSPTLPEVLLPAAGVLVVVAVLVVAVRLARRRSR